MDNEDGDLPRDGSTAHPNESSSATSYQRVPPSPTDNDESDGTNHRDNRNTSVVIAPSHDNDRDLKNFLTMAVLFSANHGCVVSCMGVATARLGAVGAWQSGILFIAYSASSVLGATYAVKTLGARDALTLGMWCYGFYVGFFWLAARVEDAAAVRATAYLGAVVGGSGGGLLWTAQGTYFGLAAAARAARRGRPVAEANAELAGYFAGFYLAEEVLMRLLSSVLLELRLASWETVFGIYTAIVFLSALAMPCVHDYRSSEGEHQDGNASAFRKATVAIKLLVNDPKMKYMIGLNATFGFVSAFLNSYVNGQVLPIALNDPDSIYVGVLTSTVPLVAAVMSLVFGKVGGGAERDSSGVILIAGALCFAGVVLPFVVQPDAARYGWASLIAVFALQGTGRATFEGTLRSTFAGYFAYEREGAFSNIVLQNGIAGGIGYILTFALTCDTPSKYCIEYSDGTLHDVLTFGLISLASALVAIGGYLRASQLYRRESSRPNAVGEEQHNSNGVAA